MSKIVRAWLHEESATFALEDEEGMFVPFCSFVYENILSAGGVSDRYKDSEGWEAVTTYSMENFVCGKNWQQEAKDVTKEFGL